MDKIVEILAALLLASVEKHERRAHQGGICREERAWAVAQLAVALELHDDRGIRELVDNLQWARASTERVRLACRPNGKGG